MFNDEIVTSGLENTLVNAPALESRWEVERAWTFRKQSHINVQESVAALKLAEHLAARRKSLQVVNLVDSNVVRCALSKGRSSSRGLTPVISKFGSVSVAMGLYFCLPFCPTRLNVSDDPTRDVSVRSPLSSGFCSALSLEQMYQVSGCRGLRRWAANWVRMISLILGARVFSFRDRSVCRKALENGVGVTKTVFCSMDFNQTLGYSGEGPCFQTITFFLLLWLSSSLSLGLDRPAHSWIFAAIF